MNLISAETDKNTLKYQMQNDLQEINNWLKLHLLSFNSIKTKYILFHGRYRHENFTDQCLNVTIETSPVARVEHMKILGIVLDEKLNFQHHFSYIKPKLFSLIYALKRIRKLITYDTAKTIYFSFFYSKLLYMNIIWRAVSKTLMKSIEIINRKMLRVVHDRTRDCHNFELYNSYLQPWEITNKISLLCFAFKIKNNMIKHNFYISYTHEKSSRDLRNKFDFIVPKINTNFGAIDPIYCALKEFNCLPTEIKKIKAFSLYKKRIKEHFCVCDLSMNENQA
jgi:hypothetical protein